MQLFSSSLSFSAAVLVDHKWFNLAMGMKHTLFLFQANVKAVSDQVKSERGQKRNRQRAWTLDDSDVSIQHSSRCLIELFSPASDLS